MSKDSNIIFDLRRQDYKYKGVLFAVADNEAIDKEMNAPFPTPKEYVNVQKYCFHVHEVPLDIKMLF